MTPQQILESLKAEGLELAVDQGNLKVRSTKTKITDEQKSLIAANKAALLVHLNYVGDERNCGSPVQTDAQATNSVPASDQSPTDARVFKEYKLPNGETLKLTKDEFDNVVEVVRLLLRQSEKLGQSSDVA